MRILSRFLTGRTKRDDASFPASFVAVDTAAVAAIVAPDDDGATGSVGFGAIPLLADWAVSILTRDGAYAGGKASVNLSFTFIILGCLRTLLGKALLTGIARRSPGDELPNVDPSFSFPTGLELDLILLVEALFGELL